MGYRAGERMVGVVMQQQLVLAQGQAHLEQEGVVDK
jgi:hypothetical protein